MPFVHGTSIALIGHEEFLIKCPCCETHSWADATIVCKYYTVYWVPFCPISKEVNIICKKCGLKREGRAFDKDLVSNYDEVKRKFKHPWYAYIGVSIMACFAFAIVAAILLDLFGITI